MIDFRNLPAELTPEQFDQIAPEIIKHILNDPNFYSAGVDEILEWDVTNGVATGVFADNKPNPPRTFSYKIFLKSKPVRVEMKALSGVED